MSNPRKLQIVDNIENVAQQLIDFILQSGCSLDEKIKHKREILGILRDVKYVYSETGYRLPLLSALVHKVHHYSRQRLPDINEAIAMLESTDASEQHFILDVISGLLKHGSCESSSANTQLLSRLITTLNQYAPLENDKRLTADAQTGFREVLRDVFVFKADQTIRDYQAYIERTNAVVRSEKPVVGKLNLPDATRQRLEGFLAKKTEPSKREVEDDPFKSNIKDNLVYAGIMAKLEVLMAQSIKDQAAKNAVAPVKVTAADVTVANLDDRAKRFAVARANMGRFFSAKEFCQVSEDDLLGSHLAYPLPQNN